MSQKRLRVPPLGPLRAFYSVAKHESITEATRELNVSASAISQSIKKLEQWYNVPLFKREKSRIFLLPEGALLRDTCDEIFELLGDATQRILSVADARTVTMSILPSFVPLKMNALLGKLASHHPDVNIMMSSSTTLTDFRYDEIDIAIRYGIDTESKYHVSELLSRDELRPCIGPTLLGNDDIDDLALLSRHRMIRDLSVSLSSPNLWENWLACSGLGAEVLNVEREIVTDNFFHAAELAASDQGIVMGHMYLLEDWIASGRLAPLFPSRKPVLSPASYYLLHRAEDNMTRQSIDVKNFLINELRRD